MHEILESENLGVEHGGVEFADTLDAVYYANLHLRTPNRILLRVADFPALSYAMLISQVRRVPWEYYLGFAKGYDLRIRARTSHLTNRRKITEVLASGIHQRLHKLGLSSVLKEGSPLVFQARIFQNRCTLSLNTSGVPLYKRGYRTHISEAPIRETLSAGVLLRCNIGNYAAIIDPYCGSGTLLIEAAMMLLKVPPGLFREFAFELTPFFHEGKWSRFKKRATSQIADSIPTMLIGSDLDQKIVGAARHNAKLASVSNHIGFSPNDARSLDYRAFMSQLGKKLIISNLPYGKRSGARSEVKASILPFLERLRHTSPGCDFAFIMKDPGLLKLAGIFPISTFPFFNGGLRVTLARGTIPYS